VNGNWRGEERLSNLTVAELRKAELNIARYVQSTFFPAVIKIPEFNQKIKEIKSQVKRRWWLVGD
jgi:vacuolar-type H+-ATPase subunit F/Vma7